MRVRVYAPPLADRRPIDAEGFVELPEGARVRELLALLRVPFPRGAVRLCQVNNEPASLDRGLAEGDRVAFLGLVAGG